MDYMNLSPADYRKLYIKFHHRYFRDERFNYVVCFYCGDETTLCDHSPSIRRLASKHLFHLQLMPNGHAKKILYYPLPDGSELRPLLVPACRSCLGLLQRCNDALTPEERKTHVVKRMLKLSGFSNFGGRKEEKETFGLSKRSLKEIYLEQQERRKKNMEVWLKV